MAECGCHNPALGEMHPDEDVKVCDEALDPPKWNCSLDLVAAFDSGARSDLPCFTENQYHGVVLKDLPHVRLLRGGGDDPLLLLRRPHLQPRHLLREQPPIRALRPLPHLQGRRARHQDRAQQRFPLHTLAYPARARLVPGLSVILWAERVQHAAERAEAEGFRVSIHPEGTPPYPDVDGLNIPTGMEAIIALRQVPALSWNPGIQLKRMQEGRERLGSPYGKCQDGASTSLVRPSVPCLFYPSNHALQGCSADSCDPPCKFASRPQYGQG